MTDRGVARELADSAAGDLAASARLFERLYDELHAMAERAMRAERADHTLQATALVHEAYLRLVGDTPVEPGGRAQFFALAARAMRRALVDHARRRGRAKRGGGLRRVTLTGSLVAGESPDPLDAVALDEALERLAGAHPEAARVVELAFYAGLPHAEIAALTGTSTRTIERHWRFARAWLHRELEP